MVMVMEEKKYIRKRYRGIYRNYLKRPLDFILSLTGIIVLSPLLIIIAILVRIKLGSPVIFRQKRPGLNEKIFTLYKFRTMTDERDENAELLPDEQRLTGFGKFLRSTSLDELPELFNIIKGNMSIVGPRPLLVEYLPLYNEQQKRRHEVRPGLTGWAQVNGRNTISWEEKFDLDVEYVDNINFLLDCKIIFLTVKKVLSREGINSDTAATMEPFQGNKNNKESVNL
jgi:undecaprenyl phosphate N,N'-diacetylbacillosamine 1-phosphate transferase